MDCCSNYATSGITINHHWLQPLILIHHWEFPVCHVWLLKGSRGYSLIVSTFYPIQKKTSRSSGRFMRCRKPLDYPSSYPMIIPIHPCRQSFPRDSKTVGTCLHQWFCDSSNGNCPNEESDVKTNWFLVLLLVILESNSDVGQGRHGIVAAASSNSMPTSLFFRHLCHIARHLSFNKLPEICTHMVDDVIILRGQEIHHYSCYWFPNRPPRVQENPLVLNSSTKVF